ncbi:MAG TPA: hypothetical protein VFK33_15130 [Bacillales bacterium]|nr:hypothetical protein [Bacillales bacterium]
MNDTNRLMAVAKRYIEQSELPDTSVRLPEDPLAGEKLIFTVILT